MRITRYGHSCLLVEEGDARLLLDPGTFSSGFEGLTGLTAVLVTHQHADHLDRDRLPALLAANPDAGLHVDEGTAARLEGMPHVVVRAGDLLDVGVRVEVVGRQHAVIHPDIPAIPNVGYLVAERFFTPGDSLQVPEADVEVLGLPVAAPWLKLSEAVDFFRAIAPRVAFPVHNGVLASPQLFLDLFDTLKPAGSSFSRLAPDGVLPL